MATKLQLYMKSGVMEYWIVDIEKESVLQYAFSQKRDINSFYNFEAGDTIKSTVFEGLEIPIKDIFSR